MLVVINVCRKLHCLHLHQTYTSAHPFDTIVAGLRATALNVVFVFLPKLQSICE